MALVADIQLQNASVVPSKLDTTQHFTAAGLTASNYLAAGEGLPITTSGLTTFVTANDLQSWFSTTKTNGDSTIFLNNDSDQKWSLGVKGTVSNRLLLQGGINTNIDYLSVDLDGSFGLGTNNPDTTTILDAQANNSASAVIQLTNTTDGTNVRIHADTNNASFGTSSNNNVVFKVNNNTIATLSNVGIDLPAGYIYTIDGLQALGGAVQTQKGWINIENNIFNASKITFLDAADSRFIWDWEYSKKYIRTTSWYTDGGYNRPPFYGMLSIDNNNSSIIWLDRDDASLDYVSFMTFTMSGNNIIDGNGGVDTINDYTFVDFKLYITTSNNGVVIVDFLEDRAYRYTVNGVETYNGNISQRNNGLGWTSISNNKSVNSNNISSISVMRDPIGSEDGFFRPQHYWAAAGSNGLSVYSPFMQDIYVDDTTNYQTIDVKTIDGGEVWWMKIEGGVNKIYYLEDVTIINSDDFIANIYGGPLSSFSPSDSDGQKIIFTDDLLSIDAFRHGNQNGGLAIFSYDQSNGVHFIHNNKSDITQSAHFYITNSYSTPYMKGGRVAGWPMDSITDRSGNNNDLTNNGTVVFSTTDAPLGNKATFNGTNQYLSISTTDFSFGVNSSYFSGWVKSSSTINPGLGEKQYVFHAWDSVGVDNNFELYFDESGYIVFEVQDNGGSTYTVSSGYDLYDAEWHYIVAQRNSTDDVLELYVDGFLIGNIAIPNTASNDTSDIYIGLDQAQTATSYFSGDISSVTISNDSFLTRKEVNYEYNRGNISITQATTKIESDSIDSLNVDINSGYAIIVAGNKANIIDLFRGTLYEKDSLLNGSLNDADIRTMTGSYTPHYLLGGTSSIQQQAANTIVA